jgi:hypothetical protein
MDEKVCTVVVDLQKVFDNSIQHEKLPLLHKIVPSEPVINVISEPETTAYPVYDGKTTIVVK